MAVVTFLEVLSHHSPGDTEQNRDIISQDREWKWLFRTG
jgi:hypothetical protein